MDKKYGKVVKNMKIHIAIFVVFAVVVLGVFSHYGAEPQEAVYKLTEDGNEEKVTLTAKGDRVSKQVYVLTRPYRAMNVADKEEAKQIVEPERKIFRGISGLVEKVE